MSDYKRDADRFDDDRRYRDNLLRLQDFYGSAPMKAIRGNGLPLCWRHGRLKQLPSASDFSNSQQLSDPELAVLIVRKLEDWEKLEDVTDSLGVVPGKSN